MRVVCAEGSRERFLDGPRREPAQEIEQASCFVVGSRSSGSSERLSTNNGSGGLVIDVKVTSCVGEGVGGLEYGRTISGKNGSS